MSLDTILQIGKALRNAEDNLKHFKYVSPCPKDKEGNYPLCITLPLDKNFNFLWNEAAITPENERTALYYLKFKSSDSDSSMRYLFGDIYYEKKSTIKKDNSIEGGEGGYYRIKKDKSSAKTNEYYNTETDNTSFKKAEENFIEMLVSDTSDMLAITSFRERFSQQKDKIENMLRYIPAMELYFEQSDSSLLNVLEDDAILKEWTICKTYEKTNQANKKKLGITSEPDQLSEEEKSKLLQLASGSLFIHFAFEGEKHWYSYKNDLKVITDKMQADFVDETDNDLVLKKSLFKTLCSGDKKNDIQFPGFSEANKHKSRRFNKSQLQDLFYAIDYSGKGKTIKGTDIKIIVLPWGQHLTETDYTDFVGAAGDEGRIKQQNKESTEEEPLFDLFGSEEDSAITTFDVIFCKKGGVSSPDIDLIEISGIEKSKIRSIRKQFKMIATSIEEERQKYLRTEKSLSPIYLADSFRSLLGSPQADLKTGKVSFKPNPRYASHLLKVLPLVYTERYYQDQVLLPAFVQNVEFSIRAGTERFSFLRFNLKYLMQIQNNQNDTHMELTESKSYKLGLLLGKLSRNLKYEINSFEKNYVGNLTRRIATLDDLIKLKNDVEQKLIMHDKTNFTSKDSYELSGEIKSFEGRYDKDECAFGFFESYFKPLPKKDNSKTEQ